MFVLPKPWLFREGMSLTALFSIKGLELQERYSQLALDQ